MRRFVVRAFLLQAVGLVAVVVGGFLVSVGAGVLSAGVVFVYVGLASEGDG